MEVDCFQNTESAHNQQEHASDMQIYTSTNTKSHVEMPGTAPRAAPKTACCVNSPLQQHAKQHPPAEHQQHLGKSTTTALSTTPETAPWNNTLSNTNPQDPSLREVRTSIAKGIWETRATKRNKQKADFPKICLTWCCHRRPPQFHATLPSGLSRRRTWLFWTRSSKIWSRKKWQKNSNIK